MATVSVAAVDLGASSGRVMLGRVGPSELRVKAVARFGNGPLRLPDGLHWNIAELYARSLAGLREAARAEPELASVGIDSWAVDYGLLREGRLLGLPFHYRDEARAGGVDSVHATVPHEELYARNGLQLLPFNTVYQLAADPWVELADRLLMIPDLLAFWLTGVQRAESTNASTTGLLDLVTGGWDRDLIGRLGYPQALFAELAHPGQRIGELLPDVAREIGVRRLTVTAVGSHDTASAVAAVPLSGDDAAYLSLGTWGLVGLELEHPVVTEESRLANFTNEGGVGGRVRFLTNVMGTWMLSECLRAWDLAGLRPDLPRLLAEAGDVGGDLPLVDVQDPRFAAPGDLPARIADWCLERGIEPPDQPAVVVRCVVESLAQAYADALDTAERLSGRTIRTVHVVGGGAQNHLLCQAVATRSGRVVVAGPLEATSLGNVVVQALAAGVLRDQWEGVRRLVARTQELLRFTPGGHGPSVGG